MCKFLVVQTIYPGLLQIITSIKSKGSPKAMLSVKLQYSRKDFNVYDLRVSECLVYWSLQIIGIPQWIVSYIKNQLSRLLDGVGSS